MNRRLQSLLLAAAVYATLTPAIGLAADGHDVSFNSSIDFRTFKRFAIRAGQISSDKPEIDNRLFRQRMENSIRATLIKKGLVEAAEHPDVSVTYSFSDTDVSTVDRQGAVRLPDSGVVIPPSGPNAVLYTAGTLVIDFTDAAGSLLWRGTWRDQERSSPILSRNVSDNARKLLADFPPKRK